MASDSRKLEETEKEVMIVFQKAKENIQKEMANATKKEGRKSSSVNRFQIENKKSLETMKREVKSALGVGGFLGGAKKKRVLGFFH